MIAYHTLFIGILTSCLFATAAPAQTTKPSRQTVVITGANRGIGLELARQYHAAGWNVIATSREPEKATELKAIGDDVRIAKLDVTSAPSVEAFAKSLDKQPIDLLINNAGVAGPAVDVSLENLKLDEFEKVIEVNTMGPMRVSQALLPNLRAGNGKMIVSITSILGSIAGNTRGGLYGYRESKAALNMFTRSLALELKPQGFTCIVVHPGWVKTDMGGADADLTPEQSVTGMRKLFDLLKPEDSGKFWTYDGTKLPW